MNKKVLEVELLSKYYHSGSRSSLIRRGSDHIIAIDNIDFDLFEGEILGLVGESGSGKSTIGKSLIKLTQIEHGKIKLFGEEIQDFSQRAFRPYRKHIQMIFQDLDAALNPGMKIGQIMADIISNHYRLPSGQYSQKIVQLLKQVYLPAQVLDQYPSELSGGQKRRVAIANVLAINPKIIIADEPTTGLDNYHQHQIIKLLLELINKQHLAMLFISHDLMMIEKICHRILVLYQGNIVERCTTKKLVAHQAHPYSQLLWQSQNQQNSPLNYSSVQSNILDATQEYHRPKQGCRFAPRCPQYIANGRPSVCSTGDKQPETHSISTDHQVTCYFPILFK